MKTKITAIILVLILGLLALNTSSQNKDVNIGALIPLTGFGAYWGGPVLKGIELAKKDLAKTFGNENVRIIIEDSQSNPTIAATAAKKLIATDGVDGLYTEFSGISSAISPIAQESGKVLVYSTFNQKIVEDNNTSIKTFVSYEVACREFASYLNNSGKKVLIISSISDAATYCENGLETGIAKENIKVVEGFTDNDFRTLLLQNKSFNPDYIIPIMYEDGSYALIKQNYELGLSSRFFCYKQDCVTEKLLEELPAEAIENTIYFEVPIDPDFVIRIKEMYPEISNDDIQAAANSYQSIIAMGEGLAACQEKDAECVTQHIANKKSFIGKGYKNLVFNDRVLSSDLSIGIVKEGEAVLLK